MISLARTLHSAAMRVVAASAFAVVALLICTEVAHAQRVTVRASGDIYAGLPFVLMVSAEGFDEEPTPVVEDFEISGAEITYLQMQPNISTSVSIFNGRRTQSRNVEFVYQYRVLVKKAGTYTVPPIKVTQDTKQASTKRANFRVKNIATTRDMRVEMTLPDRPVTVGETFDVTLDWYLRKNPEDPEFIVPLFEEVLWMDVHQPRVAPIRRRNALEFTSGDRTITLPYASEKVVLDGLEYTRFRFVANLTPLKAGTLAVEPTQVVARLPYGRPSGGIFSTQPTRMFKATGIAHTLEIQPLPLKDRPPSFANAVGTAFSIQVTAERTVVRLGDPVKLSILIRGDGRLEGLSLPKLDHPEGLPATHFSVADAPTTGEIIELEQDADGNAKKGKRFAITARVINPAVKGIPPLAFSYYNPKTKRYETIHSQPIALSVEGSNVIDGSDVVSAVSRNGGSNANTTNSNGGGSQAAIGSLIGADLSLSPTASTMAKPWSVSSLQLLLYILYALPLGFLGFRLWQLSTRDSRGEKSEVRKALSDVQTAIAQAKSTPAREAGPPILSALRALARVTGREALRSEHTIEHIETECYNPNAADTPLDADTLSAATELAKRMAREADDRRQAASKSVASAVLLLSTAALALSISPVHAQNAPEARPPTAPVTLEAARNEYQLALTLSDRNARTAGFARAELLFRQLVKASPDSPELLTDWGNAALGAQDIGHATLAYRQAMALHPRQARAKRNLSWVRERQPDWLPTPEMQGASDSLFFWHHSLSLTERHLIAALAFAVTIFLLAPWGRRQRLLRRLAFLPAMVWIGMVASIALDSPPVDDAVVIQDDIRVLSADSVGAPPALPRPLPAGTELSIIETRGEWSNIALSNGVKGWVQTSTIARVLPRNK